MCTILPSKPLSIMTHALRAAVIIVCATMALGNSLATCMLMPNSLLCQQHSEETAEEVPLETHLPTELAELTSSRRIIRTSPNDEE